MNNKQSESYNNQLQTAGKDSLQLKHPTQGVLTRVDIQALLLRSLHDSLPKNITEAFSTGNNIQFMRRACGQELNVELITLLRNLAEALQCKVGMKTGEDYEDALSVLHDYPEMTIEEVRLCFAWIRQGKIGGNWFERFKAPQLRECLGEFSAMRSEQVLEKRHKVEDNYPRLGDAKGSDVIKSLIASLTDDGPKPYTDDWLRGKTSKMTREQRQQLQEKDRQRRAQS